MYEPFAPILTKQGYGDWESFVNEQIIEAIVSKMIELYISDKGAEINLMIDKEYKGFVFIESIYQALNQYIQNRNNYFSFQAFYPEFITSVLEEISKNNHNK